MNEFMSSKKLLWFFVIIAALAIIVSLVAALFASKKSQAPVVDNNSTQGAPQFQRVNVDETSLPDRFPTSLPIETNGKVVDNFISTANDGTYQATRSYVSAATPADNYKKFLDFFRSNGWKILTSSDANATKSISAQKGTTTIQVLSYTTIDAAKNSMVKVNATIK